MTGPSQKFAIVSKFGQAENASGSERRHDSSPPETTGSGDIRDAASLAAIAQAEYAARRRRDRLFDTDLFAEPAWDMLLDLFVQRHHARPVSVHSLCIAAAVPQTTALRWIGKLAARGLIDRNRCVDDHRVIHVRLNGTGLALMETYLRGRLGETTPAARPAIPFD